MKSHLLRWSIPGVAVGLFFLLYPAASHAKTNSMLDTLLVVPNPYSTIGRTYGQVDPTSGGAWEQIRFANLPPHTTLRIYTSAGNLVRTLTPQYMRNTTAQPTFYWDMRNSDNQHIASDVYIYVADNDSLGRKVGKFVVIR